MNPYPPADDLQQISFRWPRPVVAALDHVAAATLRSRSGQALHYVQQGLDADGAAWHPDAGNGGAT